MSPLERPDALFDLASDQPPVSPPADPAAITWEQARAEYGLPDFVLRDLVKRDDLAIDSFIEACDWLTLRALDNRISRACAKLGAPVPSAVAARIAERPTGGAS